MSRQRLETVPRMIEATTVAACSGPGVVYVKFKVVDKGVLLRQVHAELSPENALVLARHIVEDAVRARALDPL